MVGKTEGRLDGKEARSVQNMDEFGHDQQPKEQLLRMHKFQNEDRNLDTFIFKCCLDSWTFKEKNLKY